MTVRPLFRAAGLAGALVLPTMLNAGPAAAACETQAQEALRQLSVPPSDVTSVKVVKRSAGAKSGSNYTYDAWVGLNSCRGHLVIPMTRGCLVQQSYTTGDCRVGGLPRN